MQSELLHQLAEEIFNRPSIRAPQPEELAINQIAWNALHPLANAANNSAGNGELKTHLLQITGKSEVENSTPGTYVIRVGQHDPTGTLIMYALNPYERQPHPILFVDSHNPSFLSVARLKQDHEYHQDPDKYLLLQIPLSSPQTLTDLTENLLRALFLPDDELSPFSASAHKTPQLIPPPKIHQEEIKVFA